MLNRPKVLTDSEVAFYHREGYLVPQFQLSENEVKQLQEMTDRLLDHNTHIKDGMIGSPHLVNGAGTQNVKSEAGWMDIAAHPKIIDMLEQLIGPDIMLWTSTMFYKPPVEGNATPWHRDGAFYPIAPLETVTVWIASFESVKDNACLRVIPGSHLNRSIGRHKDGHWSKSEEGGALDTSEFNEADAVDVELQPGQMVIFDVYTIHGSRPNLGKRSRAGYAVRFFPSTCHYDHSASDDEYKVAGGVAARELILVRGEDKANNKHRRLERK